MFKGFYQNSFKLSYFLNVALFTDILFQWNATVYCQIHVFWDYK